MSTGLAQPRHRMRSEALPVKQAVFAELERYAWRICRWQAIPRAAGSRAHRRRPQDAAADAGPALPSCRATVPAVEVIRGEHTDPAVIEKAYAIMAALNKKPVRVQRDVPGFLANRIQHAMMREAISLVEQGFASAEDVDTAARYGFGCAMSPPGRCCRKTWPASTSTAPPREHVSSSMQRHGAESAHAAPRQRGKDRRESKAGLLRVERCGHRESPQPLQEGVDPGTWPSSRNSRT